MPESTQRAPTTSPETRRERQQWHSPIDTSQEVQSHRKEQGDELTDETDHPIRSLICSPPVSQMDSPYSARFRLV